MLTATVAAAFLVLMDGGIGIGLAVLGAALAIALFMWRPLSQSSRRASGAFHAQSPNAQFIGGAKWKTGPSFSGRASWPMVELRVLNEGIAVQPSRKWLGWAVPTIELEWSSIRSVERTALGVKIVRCDVGESGLCFSQIVIDFLTYCGPIQ